MPSLFFHSSQPLVFLPVQNTAAALGVEKTSQWVANGHYFHKV
jgi:hypothetical protein